MIDTPQKIGQIMKDEQFTNYFMAILGILITMTVVIFIIARSLSSIHEEMDVAMINSINERIKPVGLVYTGNEAGAASTTSQSADAPPAADATAEAPDGKTIYETVCAVCHMAGIANAPILGDKAAWAPRLGDINALYMSVITGKNAMPPRAGRPDLSDEALHAAVDYMVEAVR